MFLVGSKGERVLEWSGNRTKVAKTQCMQEYRGVQVGFPLTLEERVDYQGPTSILQGPAG